MANPLRDMSVIMQGLLALAIAAVLVLAGVYVLWRKSAMNLIRPCVRERNSPRKLRNCRCTGSGMGN